MFTQKCFIRKNTPELVKKLEELGYELVVVGRHSRERWIFCYDKYAVSRSEAIIGRDWIDCGTNDELFLAIAALRDDSDKFQWFTDGNGYWQQCIGSFKFPSLAKEKLHKATVQELIEHFKP